MADDKIRNEEKAKGVGAGATYGTQHEPEQDKLQRNAQKGEAQEQREYPDYRNSQQGMKNEEPPSENNQ